MKHEVKSSTQSTDKTSKWQSQDVLMAGSEQWWLEIDNTLDPDEVESLKETKETLLNYDLAPGVGADLDEDFFDQLHSKIMSKVDEAELAKAKFEKLQKLKKKWTRSSAVALWALAVIISKPVHKEDTSQMASDQLYLHFAKNPESFGQSVLSQDSQDDVLVELARIKASELNADQINSLFENSESPTQN